MISGNGNAGVEIRPNESGNLIQGNYIGTNPALAAGLGNLDYGIRLWDAGGATTIVIAGLAYLAVLGWRRISAAIRP